MSVEFGLTYQRKTRTDFVQRPEENIWTLEGDTKEGGENCIMWNIMSFTERQI
jgi:hypothetical protein